MNFKWKWFHEILKWNFILMRLNDNEFNGFGNEFNWIEYIFFDYEKTKFDFRFG